MGTVCNLFPEQNSQLFKDLLKITDRETAALIWAASIKYSDKRVGVDKELQSIKQKTIANGTFMKAPNGKPTNLNERQWLQVRTKAFKEWFGDWISNPEQSSKVVDENGEPLVVYHGTYGNFDIFDPTKKRYTVHTKGLFFTTTEHKAKFYGKNVLPVFLNLKNPSISYYNGNFTIEELRKQENLILNSADDGAIFNTIDKEGKGLQYIVFNTNQIKSATDNIGNFSSENNNIKDTNINLVDFLEETELWKLLKPSEQLQYIAMKEGLMDKQFNTLQEAIDYIESFKDNYNNIVAEYTQEGDNIVTSLKDDSFNTKKEEYVARRLQTLNTQLIDYLNDLGFDVEEVEGLEHSVFKPLEAETNAKNLKTVIKIAKNKQGQKDLPEEFAHFISKGFNDSKLKERLKSLLTLDKVKEVLGDDLYTKYNEIYSGKDNIEELLQEEAIAHLIAQNLAIRSGIPTDIQYISNRFLDQIKTIFAKGDEAVIDSFIKELNDSINEFIDMAMGNDRIELFDEESLLNSSELYSAEEAVNKLKKISEENLKTVAKRIKLKYLYNPNDISNSESALYNDLKKADEKAEYFDSCSSFFSYVLNDCKDVFNSLQTLKEKAKKNPEFTLTQLKYAFKQIREVETIVSAYSTPLEEMSQFEIEDFGDISEEDFEEYQNTVNEVNTLINKMNKLRKELQVTTLVKLFQPYWDKNKIRR